MKLRLAALLLTYILLTSINSWGQRAKITGYVHDADGKPLELVNVHVKNTLVGAVTNDKGYYTMGVSKGDSVTLVYSCLGFNKAERIIPRVVGDMRLNVQMNYTSLELGGVTVTAIRKQTTTMETLQADKIKLLPDPAGGSIESLI